ncbi:hypothetical protein H634G_06302 [Metarhizium anisopliae BRIP 53293]|uniref:Alpha-ketoglutarate-dependent sulfonate dioxygenase n=1 Tax=Metarhizium anisopliae BRIP 53293 TaxID=1291518 RepID=A0A0D9NZY4_METAN|nr:hypothetical protein H634G_06302 [Metarhizium anisopliae BRIP 53293]KJK87287.1 hypothetical protein H633G_08859 [Metarhizium anisopliae BRIP 53284]
MHGQDDRDGVAPPAYAVEQAEAQPPVDVDTTAAFAHLSLETNIAQRRLTVDTCLAHLKLLHAIHNLKEEVGYTDGLFGLYDSRAGHDADGFDLDAIHAGKGIKIEDAEKVKLALSKIREKRWALFVARAVDRYETWWRVIQGQNHLTQDMMAEPASDLYANFPILCKDPRGLGPDMLPPLDVLMVFHSHMLNPRAFLEDSMRSSMKGLWQDGMPWPLINEAIDTNFDYSVSDACQTRWTQATGRCWANTGEPMVKIINCPHCQVPNHIPWTTCGDQESTNRQDGLSGLVGSGYGDGKLSHQCVACHCSICKEALSVRKFVQDSALLLAKSVPMPGTILDPQNGMPEPVPSGHQENVYPRTFPNRMIELDLRIQIQEIFKSHRDPTMETVKSLVEGVLRDSSRLCRINSMPPRWSSRYKIPPKSKNCVRKMMSRYWENFSPFALDLCGAVMRQGVFIDKMVKLDWLHSPSARETMARLIDKYVKFMELMRRHPKQIAVPTLDVDLAWHTHQLIPPSYYADTTRATSKFIDHDDKIEEVKLNQAFEWTSKTYQVLFHELYSECTCWYCEAIRASHTSSLNSFLGTSKGDKYAQDFYQSGRAGRCPPDNSAHISAHNAVRSADASRGPVSAYLRSRQEESLERNYQKAVKRAEKKGRTLPPRNDYYDHWGYSYFMYSPAVYPLYLAPGMYYGWDPCYVHTGAGAWGGCAAGSCGGGGVAAGAAADLEREVVAAQEAAEEDRDREAAEVAEEEEDVEAEEAAAADVEGEAPNCRVQIRVIYMVSAGFVGIIAMISAVDTRTMMVAYGEL